MSTRYFVGVAVLCLLAGICLAAQVRPDQVDRGGEWLSWTPEQRATYADGFITGYLQGFDLACEATDELFEVGQPHSLGDEHHPSEIPSARCLARMEEYSRASYTETTGPDFSAYTDVITEFYTEHPEYQDVPFVELMKQLSDRNHKTADQLYQMALKGKLPRVR
jgi:hypothetical protein